jgi:hypothetical protein
MATPSCSEPHGASSSRFEEEDKGQRGAESNPSTITATSAFAVGTCFGIPAAPSGSSRSDALAIAPLTRQRGRPSRGSLRDQRSDGVADRRGQDGGGTDKLVATPARVDPDQRHDAGEPDQEAEQAHRRRTLRGSAVHELAQAIATARTR